MNPLETYRNLRKCGDYRYAFNGMEKDDEVKGAGNSYDFGARMYDSRLGRWLSVDPKMSSFEGPYVGMGNNPIAHNDPMGDRIKGLRKLKRKDPVVYRKIMDDLRKMTGLDLRVNMFGTLKYKKGSAGQPTRTAQWNKSSAVARNFLMNMIDSKSMTVHIKTTRTRATHYEPFVDEYGNVSATRGTIFINTVQTDVQMHNSHNVNPKTVGYGLTFFHEAHHWFFGSRDPVDIGPPAPPGTDIRSTGTGPTVDFVNRIRAELDAAHPNSHKKYGQRQAYYVRLGVEKYIPFDWNSNSNILRNNVGKNDKYTKVIDPLRLDNERDFQLNPMK